MNFTRYGVYFTPSDAGFVQAAAEWLGWDIVAGADIAAPVPHLVERPQKYGFHATLKPPFRLAPQTSEDGLHRAVRTLATQLAPVPLGAMAVSQIGRFFAFTCAQPNDALQALAATVVRDLDTFRAEATEEEIAKRLHPGLSETQVQYVHNWGYPHVMECFRFHMTLTGPVPKGEAPDVVNQIDRHFADTLPQSTTLDALSLVAERPDGKFVLLERVPLTGMA